MSVIRSLQVGDRVKWAEGEGRIVTFQRQHSYSSQGRPTRVDTFAVVERKDGSRTSVFVGELERVP